MKEKYVIAALTQFGIMLYICTGQPPAEMRTQRHETVTFLYDGALYYLGDGIGFADERNVLTFDTELDAETWLVSMLEVCPIPPVIYTIFKLFNPIEKCQPLTSPHLN